MNGYAFIFVSILSIAASSPEPFFSLSAKEIDAYDFVENPEGIYASRSPKGELAVIYFPSGKEIKMKDGILNGELKASWYNPRNGQWSKAICRQDNSYDAPDVDDWALLLKE